MSRTPYEELPLWFSQWAQLNPGCALSLRRSLLAHPAGGCKVYLPMPLNRTSMYRFPEAGQFMFSDAGPPGAKSTKS